MKIVVCTSHVPDSATKVNIGGDGKTIDKAGVNFIISPYDEFAIEESLRFKEKNGGEVVAVSLGGDPHKETLRKTLAMGADKAVLLKDESSQDSFSVARAIADYVKEVSPDIVFFGKQSIDTDNAAVGSMVAEMLGIPSVSVVVKLEMQSGKVIAEREIEGGHEKVEARLPCVITAQKGLNEPRYPSLKGIMGAKNKPIEERAPAARSPKVQLLGMRKPLPKNPGKIVGTDVSAVPQLVKLLHEEAKVI
ncbi:MAG: electron transfer flavoprotein subunit beta/FixA family protein [Ignavibacteriales bacterium]|nr:electron transfer flavoprotein subunit beta/FixA family protein [Ignavibacteriales bacterium]